MSAATQTAPVVVTEEDLLKSLREVEGKAATPATEIAPVVQTTTTTPTAAAVLEAASTELRKSIDASKPLREIVDAVGLHVDNSLTALQKSVQAGAERDMLVIAVLKDMKKSIEDLSAQVKEFGNAPAGTVTTQSPAATTQALQKGAPAGKIGETGLTKANVATGLFELAKSCTPGTPEAQRWVNAAVKFEAAQEISDGDLQLAVGKYRKMSSGN